MHTFVFGTGKNGELKLITEDFNPISPGLSSYKEDPSIAGESLLPLLEKSKQIVPAHLHSSTPVFLRATAGLRMLGDELSERILDDAREILRESGFRFDSEKWATILDGNDEGIYSWITVNYLLGRKPGETAGTLEMGGGSSQIAFVPSEKEVESCETTKESVQYKGMDLGLYTVSHLGFGIKKAKQDVIDAALVKTPLQPHPCLSKGTTAVEIPFEDPPKTVEMEGSGSFALCTKVISETIMTGAGQCDCGLCTYQQEPQPKAAKDFVALAFYKERTVDLGLQNPVSMKDIREFGEKVCTMSVDQVKSAFPNVANGEATDLCFDVSFIYQHLSEGHGIREKANEGDNEPTIFMASKIEGIELGWSLGAMFAELSNLSAKDR
mmetsp:Transcript_38686/g.152734  ORF Transcript_38686/g.152734 Transcript_38686/m.152734 type:complete len:382 (-) Transcript_38686:323-1468(-)